MFAMVWGSRIVGKAAKIAHFNPKQISRFECITCFIYYVFTLQVAGIGAGNMLGMILIAGVLV